LGIYPREMKSACEKDICTSMDSTTWNIYKFHVYIYAHIYMYMYRYKYIYIVHILYMCMTFS
jgi:hypothetical protein